MIRFATENDIEKIMLFIDLYWKKNHILSRNIDFFRYEHLLEEGVTYVISENDKGEIEAILGYIPYGKKNRDIMTVMWKANHTDNPTLGLDLFDFLKKNADVRIMASPGSNKKLRSLYRYLGYDFGKMTHWYRLCKKDSYSIAKVENANIPIVTGNSIKYLKLDSWGDVIKFFDFSDYYNKKPKPLKEEWYIKKRYFDHPIYNYDVYGVIDKSGEHTLIVFRKIYVGEAVVLRLIDCIGNNDIFRDTSTMMDDLLEKIGAEYVDCYEVGICDEIFQEGGWLKVESSGNIIPNYFAPFVQENIDIYYFSTDSDIVLFKGDGDQDRPN
jgi:hypothetical protein